MTDPSGETPVAIIAFRRPELTARVLDAVRRWRPRTLHLICDGPRGPADLAPCKAVREVFETVDWECQIHRDYADENMGLRKRVHSGLSGVFARSDRSIILEDDCVPDPSFYRFCDALLDRYADDDRVSLISGDNAHGFAPPNGESYSLSRYSLIWGWASWARAWAHYDLGYDAWPDARDSHFLYSVFRSQKAADWWTKTFDANHDGGNSWATIWLCANLIRGAGGIQPAANMISNVGFGEEATHTKGTNPVRESPKVAAAPEILRHPADLAPSDEGDALIDKIVFSRDPHIYRGDGPARYDALYADAMRRILVAEGADALAANALIATYRRQLSRGADLPRANARASVDAVIARLRTGEIRPPENEARFLDHARAVHPGFEETSAAKVLAS